MKSEAEVATVDAKAYQIPRLLRATELVCADGRVLRGRVFLPATAEAHAGAMRVEEWLEDPALFFPFLPDGEGQPVLLNKEQLLMLTIPRASEEEGGPATARRRRVHVECGALRVDGEVVIDMPASQSRMLDLLNRPGAFLAVQDGGRCHLVRKSWITRVSEPSGTAPAA